MAIKASKGQVPAPTAGAFPKAIQYKDLKSRHSEYMTDFWARCRALYAGGPALLEKPDLLAKIMPKHGNEEDTIYKERMSRAFYIPYPGSIVDKIVAELMAKPITFDLENTTAGSDDGGTSERSEVDNLPMPPFYTDLQKNCGKPGGKKCTLNQFARDQIFTALQCKSAWSLVDMPKAPIGGYPNKQEQDKAGALNAYICSIDPECVVDWEEEEDGELAWVLLQDSSCKRDGIMSSRNAITMRWRYYTKDAWAVYEYTFDKTKKIGPADKDEALLVDSGKHSFTRVPVRRLQLPDGLWAMGKLEAMARAHMNQRNALSWGQLKALYPVPILYAMAPVVGDPVSEDAGRANQTHGQGYLRVLAEKDRMEYFSPDVAPYEVAAKDLNVLRDEMHRVLHSMAMSVDNSGAALGRSGESKAIDQAAASVILRALGTYLREYLEDLLGLIATGRKDNMRFCAQGMDNFDDITLTQLVLDAIGISTIDIQSATFQKKFKLKVAKLALGPDASEEDLEDISDELDSTNTQDQLEAVAEADQAGAEANQIGHQARAAVSAEVIKNPAPKITPAPKLGYGAKTPKAPKTKLEQGAKKPKQPK